MSFDTLSPYCRGMEFALAANLLQRCRTTFFAETESSRRALLPGEGPDRFLKAGGFQLASRRLANFGLANADLWRRTASNSD